uniref:Uncharacterized protein n=1 Tax=Rhizophora mucronata TaxID=61149 RepID=A0A2P2R0D1_RHIMU
METENNGTLLVAFVAWNNAWLGGSLSKSACKLLNILHQQNIPCRLMTFF